MKLIELINWRKRKQRAKSDAEKLVEITKLNAAIRVAREAYLAETEHPMRAISLFADYTNAAVRLHKFLKRNGELDKQMKWR